MDRPTFPLANRAEAIAAKQIAGAPAPPVLVSVLDDLDAVHLAEVKRGHQAAAWARLVPPVYGDPTLAKVRDGGTDSAVVDELDAWSNDPTRNLLLFGPVGTGKSFTAWATLRRPFGAGRSIAHVAVVDLMDAFRPDGDPEILRKARTADLLFVDDLGANRGTEWTDERLYQLIHHRWEQQLPVVATTNAAKVSELAEVVGERIASRLGDGALLLHLTGKDRRRGAAR